MATNNQLRMSDVVRLVGTECDNFVDRFFTRRSSVFAEPESVSLGRASPAPNRFQVFQQFQQEADLALQSALTLWGLAREKAFSQDFIEDAARSQALDKFLALNDWVAFEQQMRDRAVAAREQDAKLGEDSPEILAREAAARRPETPLGDDAVRKRLAMLDWKLAEMEAERSALLMERWRLAGCAAEPTTVPVLKRLIQQQRYQEEVGLD